MGGVPPLLVACVWVSNSWHNATCGTKNEVSQNRKNIFVTSGRNSSKLVRKSVPNFEEIYVPHTSHQVGWMLWSKARSKRWHPKGSARKSSKEGVPVSTNRNGASLVSWGQPKSKPLAAGHDSQHADDSSGNTSLPKTGALCSGGRHLCGKPPVSYAAPKG